MRFLRTAGILTAVAASVFADPPFERFIVSSIDQYAVSAYPTVTRLDDGRLLCVFSAMGEKTAHKAVIAGAFSQDHGRTWGRPVVLIDSKPDLDYDPNIIVIGPRVIVTSTTVPPTHGHFVSTSRTVAVRSEDNGKTWSKPYEIPMGHRYTAGKIHSGIMLQNGTVMFGYAWDASLEKPGQRIRSEGEQECFSGVMISADRGETWKPSHDVHLNKRRSVARTHAINGLDEPAIVECSDGSVLMLCRTGLDRLYQCRSLDSGYSWQDIKASALTSHNAPAAMCRVRGDPPGLLVVWNNSPTDRWPLCAALSTDDGNTWGPPRQLALKEGFQSSYPGCTQAADGALIVVWQQALEDDRRGIVGARFGPEWLLEPPAPATGEASPRAAGASVTRYSGTAPRGERLHED